jgi:hypothetical protein
LAGSGAPAVRTSRSAFCRTQVFSGCSRAKKLKATNRTQNISPTSMTLRWVLLSALWNDDAIQKPYSLPARAQSDSIFNLADEGYSPRTF